MEVFLLVLQILFIGLKLGKKIDWAWGWVLSPLWIGLITLLIQILFVIFMAWGFISLV